MVDPFGVVGLIGTIDTTYHWGKELVALCKAFATAEIRFHESVVRVEACWLKIQMQLEFVRRLEPQLPDWHRNMYQEVLKVLLDKLEAANTKLSGLVKRSDALPNDSGEERIIVEVKRLKYAFVRDSLAETITELEVWQGIFDPGWWLMMKIAGPEVDQQLYSMSQQQPVSKHKGTQAAIPTAQHFRRALKPVGGDTTQNTIFLASDGLIAESVQDLAYSPVRIARRANNGQLVVLDPITCTSRANINSALRNIRDFARDLQHTDPFTFGLLQCKGILREDDSDSATKQPGRAIPPTGFSFVFRMPPTHSHVHSLRSRLLRGSNGEHDSLLARFDLARQLVKAVSYVHLYEFVHKNIRPETILMLSKENQRYSNTRDDDEADADSEIAVLVGFDVLRDAEGKTQRLGDDDWEKNIYRHPHRQGKSPEVDYDMRHDIYSVGVCLLEIGLWESFVEYDKADENNQSSLAINLRPSNPGSKLAAGADAMGGFELLKSPERVKDRLLQLVRGALRRKMGIKYSKVVETCLTCLDQSNEDFGDEREFQDIDGVAVGARYIDKVVRKLGEISV